LLTYFRANVLVLWMERLQFWLEGVEFLQRESRFSHTPYGIENVHSPAPERRREFCQPFHAGEFFSNALLQDRYAGRDYSYLAISWYLTEENIAAHPSGASSLGA